MSIYVKSLDDIAAMLVVAGATSVVSNDIKVIALKPTPSGESVYNTKAVIQMQPSNTSFTGTTIVYFDRLDLSELVNLGPLDKTKYLTFSDVDVSIYTMLDSIRDAVGIQFTTDDLVETQTVAADDGTDVTLTAKSTSLGWTGTVTLRFSGLPNIINAFNGRALTGF